MQEGGETSVVSNTYGHFRCRESLFASGLMWEEVSIEKTKVGTELVKKKEVCVYVCVYVCMCVSILYLCMYVCIRRED